MSLWTYSVGYNQVTKIDTESCKGTQIFTSQWEKHQKFADMFYNTITEYQLYYILLLLCAGFLSSSLFFLIHFLSSCFLITCLIPRKIRSKEKLQPNAPLLPAGASATNFQLVCCLDKLAREEQETSADPFQPFLRRTEGARLYLLFPVDHFSWLFRTKCKLKKFIFIASLTGVHAPGI